MLFDVHKLRTGRDVSRYLILTVNNKQTTNIQIISNQRTSSQILSNRIEDLSTSRNGIDILEMSTFTNINKYKKGKFRNNKQQR